MDPNMARLSSRPSERVYACMSLGYGDDNETVAALLAKVKAILARTYGFFDVETIVKPGMISAYASARAWVYGNVLRVDDTHELSVMMVTHPALRVAMRSGAHDVMVLASQVSVLDSAAVCDCLRQFGCIHSVLRSHPNLNQAWVRFDDPAVARHVLESVQTLVLPGDVLIKVYPSSYYRPKTLPGVPSVQVPRVVRTTPRAVAVPVAKDESPYRYMSPRERAYFEAWDAVLKVSTDAAHKALAAIEASAYEAYFVPGKCFQCKGFVRKDLDMLTGNVRAALAGFLRLVKSVA